MAEWQTTNGGILIIIQKFVNKIIIFALNILNKIVTLEPFLKKKLFVDEP